MSIKNKKIASVIGEVIGMGISVLVTIHVVPIFPFITENYAVWLPIGIVTTIISSVFKLGKHIFGEPLAFLFEALSLIPSIYSIYMLIQIFPIDFGLVGLPSFNPLIQFAFNISIIGLVIAIVVNLSKFVFYNRRLVT